MNLPALIFSIGAKRTMLKIRDANPADAPAIAHVTVATWRSTYTGIVPDHFLASMSESFLSDGLRQTLSDPLNTWLMLVAETEGDGIVGIAAAHTNVTEPGYSSELQALYILPSHQRLGIGRELMAATAQGLSKSGHTSMMLWVFEGNPAMKFYERLGGLPLHSGSVAVFGLTIDAYAYGWSDTATLYSPASPR